MRVDVLIDQGTVTLTKSWEVDGTRTDVGTVTAELEAPDGTVTSLPVAKEGTGTATTYKVGLPSQPEVTELRLTWTRTADGSRLWDWVSVRGDQLFSEAQLRGFDDRAVSEAVYPDELIAETRLRITDGFEGVCDTSFVPRYARRRLAGDGSPVLRLGARGALVYGGPGADRRLLRLLRASSAGIALTASEIAAVETDGRRLYRTDGGVWARPSVKHPLPVTVEYSYGWDTPPEEVRRAALTLARYEVVVRDVSDRMISFADPNLGQVRLSIPGPNRLSGLPLVDSVLDRHRESPILV